MTSPTAPAPIFEFDYRLTQADRGGYYVTRWDRAQKITLTATTKDEAFTKAVAVLGAPRPGRYWTGICDAIREVQLLPVATLECAHCGNDTERNEA